MNFSVPLHFNFPIFTQVHWPRRIAPCVRMAIRAAAATCLCLLVCWPVVCKADQQKTKIDGLLDELDDVDLMRSLSPLKLTSEQIDKLITAITDARTRYDKKISDLTDATIGAMADEIHKRHKEAVAGGPVSEAFDTKVKKVVADFYAKRDVVNSDNLVEMIATCGKILTADQQKTAGQLEKDTLTKLGTKLDPANTTAQYFNKYVADIFIGYRRIVPLLQLMKAAS